MQTKISHNIRKGEQMTPIIEIKDLSAGYNGKTIIENISLTVFENDFLGIIGPNGGGKTTLLRTILGLLKPYKGTISFFDNGVPCDNIAIGYLPQYSKID